MSLGDVALRCLIDRVKRTIAKGDEKEIRALQNELLHKRVVCESFEWYVTSARVAKALYILDLHLGETNVKREYEET